MGAQVVVVNVGAQAGKEVVQAYLKFPDVLPGMPSLRLAGFRKTTLLHPGEHQLIELKFSPRDISTYSAAIGWKVQDNVMICLGVSSLDIRACSKLLTPNHMSENTTTLTSTITTVFWHGVQEMVNASTTADIPTATVSEIMRLPPPIAAFDDDHPDLEPMEMSHGALARWSANIFIISSLLTAVIVAARRAAGTVAPNFEEQQQL